MDEKVFKRFDGDRVTDDMLEEASKLFSENYPRIMGRVCLFIARFGISSYVRVSVNGRLAGNAFACRWAVDGMTICWVTQLVVHRDYRERGLASGLLNKIKLDGDDAYGLISSHPAACLAASKAFRSSINTVSLDFMKDHAESIMKASPEGYVRDAKLRGKLFDPKDDNGLVSSVDTEFDVDHEEPLEALAWVRESMEWPLGELFDGHEFILILQARRRSRPRSSSARRSGTT
ncbi:hypothetical protein BDY21DRAFT_417402 [Lineolata rhizophorae]|uniref:N-acetyltransferase domain-containing protein n=1 Tax=Lineolata rhizophorae TaxID=578093 RepID=A0A6A6NMS9_9PEZI|nr:hypothetical protein BDY21DRAFT_417402 [Lineolata rhizophorae]